MKIWWAISFQTGNRKCKIVSLKYQLKLKVSELENKLTKIQKDLDALDLKSIRALREGGKTNDGVLYIDFYQNQINDLRSEYSELNTEKINLEAKLYDLIN